MISPELYFDWAATSVPDEEIIRKSLDASLESWGNPSSIHAAGTEARGALESARQRAAGAMGVKPEKIFFTSGGTESDHIPLLSVLSRPQKGSVVLSSIEHPAVREMARMISSCGWRAESVRPDKNGFVSPGAIAEAVHDDTALVAVMAVNNETGAVQDIRGIADAVAEKSRGKRRPLLHVDCVQAAGKIPLDLEGMGIDSAAFSAHKIGGPRGIGILYLAREITPFMRGGGQEKNIRSGTENLFGAHAMSLCLEKYFISEKNSKAVERLGRQVEFTADFMRSLLRIRGASIIPRCRGEEGCRLEFSPWIVQAAFAGIPGQVMERALSSEGFYISTGSACSSGRHSRPVLDAMQISAKEKESAVRFSFGVSTTKKAMDDLLEAVESVVKKFNP